MPRIQLTPVPLVALASLAVAFACAQARGPSDGTRSDRLSVRASPRDEARPERIAADVAWLADDLREGRRAGTSAAASAADWLAARCAEIGLEPAGEKGFLQEFEVPLEPRDGGASDLVVFPPKDSGDIRGNGGSGSTKVFGSADVAPLFCAERGRVEGPLVSCGYGIEDAESGRNDFAGVDLEGAIAFIVRGVPKKLPASAAGSAPGAEKAEPEQDLGAGASIFTKVMNAKRHGAIAVLLAPGAADEPMLRFEAGHGARAGIPALALGPRAAAALFPGYAVAQESRAASGEATRPSGVGGMAAVAGEAERTAGSAKPGRVSVFADVLRENGPAQNVLARLRGRNPDRVVVVGAHYDHLGRGGAGSLAPGSGEIHNGADDNASGTAVVLEIARLLVAEEERPACDVLFALWSGEEVGLFGSEHWARHPTVPIEAVAANLNLDMVGRAGSGKLQVLGAGTSSGFAGWMEDAGRHSGLELLVSTTGGALGGSSDHQSFLKRKIPALHLFSGLHVDYHKPSDDVLRFEAEGAAKVAVLGADLVRRMAQAENLAFVEPKVDPETAKRHEQGQGGFRAWFGSIPSYVFEGPGVLIDGTSAGSPAERAGFLKGDVLRQVGDVVVENIYDFTYALQHYKPGDVVLVRFLRDGAEEETRVTLSSREMR